MATTPEEILAKGKGPVQKTLVDQPQQQEVQTTSQPSPEVPAKPTENVNNGAVAAAQGTSNNSQSGEGGAVNDGALASKVASTPKEGFYTQWLRENSTYQPPTKEELEKERKKQKRESIFAAISDGIAALSNLYFTSQYAPNAYDPSKGMSATTKARFDKLKKEREDKHRQYMEGFMRAMQLDESANYKDTLAQLKDREQKRKDAATNISIALKQADIDLKDAKKDGQEYLNELYRLKGVAFANGMDAETQLIEEKIKTEKARQYNLYHRGTGGSGGKSPEYPWYDSAGNLHYSSSYEAMRQNAINNGTWSEATQESTTEREQKDRRGNTKGTSSSTTVKPAKGHSTKPESKKPESKGHSEQTQPKWSNASKIKY